MNEMEKNLENVSIELSLKLDGFDWFHSTVIEGNSVCVYTTHMTAEIMKTVPEFVRGVHIKLGFASYLECGNKYNKVIYLNKENDLDFDDNDLM